MKKNESRWILAGDILWLLLLLLLLEGSRCPGPDPRSQTPDPTVPRIDPRFREEEEGRNDERHVGRLYQCQCLGVVARGAAQGAGLAACEMWEAMLELDVITHGIGRARRRPGRRWHIGAISLSSSSSVSILLLSCSSALPFGDVGGDAILQLCGDVSERAPDLEGREGQITGGREVWLRLSKARDRRNTYPAFLTLLLPRPPRGEG